VSCNVSHHCVLYVTGVYITGVLLLQSPVAVPAMWVVVSAPEMCCLVRNVVSLWGWTYIPVVTAFSIFYTMLVPFPIYSMDLLCALV
jgi:hypothetical protein